MIYQRKPIDKTLIFIVLIIVISAIYLWYFQIYIKSNEKLLTEKGYRVLNRIEGNMENKISDQFVRFINYGSLLEKSSEIRNLTYFTKEIHFLFSYYNLETLDDTNFNEKFQYF